MFDNIRLFTKTDNKIQEPNLSWTEKSKIYCSCELNLGFGTGKVIWDFGNAIKLTYLIDFFKQLRTFSIYSNSNTFSYEFGQNDKKYCFEWTKNDDFSFKVSVKRGYFNSKYILLEKYFGHSNLFQFHEEFYLTIMTILTSNSSEEVTVKIGELFYDHNNSIHYEFKIGQRVRTIVGQNVKTERAGWVINKWYHDKEKSTMYQILENGKKLEKRYFPTDLELDK